MMKKETAMSLECEMHCQDTRYIKCKQNCHLIHFYFHLYQDSEDFLEKQVMELVVSGPEDETISLIVRQVDPVTNTTEDIPFVSTNTQFV